MWPCVWGEEGHGYLIEAPEVCVLSTMQDFVRIPKFPAPFLGISAPRLITPLERRAVLLLRRILQ